MKESVRFKAYLAILVTVSVIGIIILLMTIPMPNGAEKVAFMAIGGLLTQLGTVLNYFFGSSASSDKKTDLIAQAQPIGVLNGTDTADKQPV